MLEILFAQDSGDINPRGSPLEDHSIITRSEPIQIFLIPSKFLDPLPVGNRIIRETQAIGNNLVSELCRKSIKVVLRLLGQEDAEGHTLFVLRLVRRRMYSDSGLVRAARMSLKPASIFLRSCGL